jgi:predicted dehydrogenase
MARLVAGVSRGRDFADPLEVKGIARIGPTGVDHWAAACLRFPDDILAQVSAGVEVQQENVVRIFGSEGYMFLPNHWVAGREKGDPGSIVFQRGGVTREVTVPADRTSFTYEADIFSAAVLGGSMQPAYPAMSTDDTLGQMATLDRWRQSIGLTYTGEAPA